MKNNNNTDDISLLVQDVTGRTRVLPAFSELEFEENPKNPYGKYLTSFEHVYRKTIVAVDMFENGDVFTIKDKNHKVLFSNFFPVDNHGEQKEEF